MARRSGWRSASSSSPVEPARRSGIRLRRTREIRIRDSARRLSPLPGTRAKPRSQTTRAVPGELAGGSRGAPRLLTIFCALLPRSRRRPCCQESRGGPNVITIRPISTCRWVASHGRGGRADGRPGRPIAARACLLIDNVQVGAASPTPLETPSSVRPGTGPDPPPRALHAPLPARRFGVADLPVCLEEARSPWSPAAQARRDPAVTITAHVDGVRLPVGGERLMKVDGVISGSGSRTRRDRQLRFRSHDVATTRSRSASTAPTASSRALGRPRLPSSRRRARP
jgi:hypothetical protein